MVRLGEAFLLPTSHFLLPTSWQGVEMVRLGEAFLLPTSHFLPPTSCGRASRWFASARPSYFLLPTSYFLLPTSYLPLPTSYFLWQGVEMVRLGEAILSHFREERAERSALLGDAPLPAGVDEEKLERSLLRVRSRK